MDSKNIKKEYHNKDITIVWQSAKCTHSGNCVKNNPAVFNPKIAPWISPEKSSTASIIAAVQQCPSGALTYYYNNTSTTENYNNLIEAIAGLKAQGYTEDFNVKQHCITCNNGEQEILPAEFHIDKSFRFDADTNPSEESIIYAIASEKYDLKGILINGYGISASPLTNEMLAKLQQK